MLHLDAGRARCGPGVEPGRTHERPPRRADRPARRLVVVQRPAQHLEEDLRLAVELGQAGDELATDEQQPDQRGQGARGKLEQGKRDGDIVRRDGALQAAERDSGRQAAAEHTEELC